MRLRFNVSPAWYADAQGCVEIARYLWSHAGKYGQKEVPEDFKNVGRFWGVLGGSVRDAEREFCCERAYFMVRRAVRTIQEKRVGRRRNWRGYGLGTAGGSWTAVSSGTAVADRLYLWSLRQCGCRRSRVLLGPG